MSNLRNGLDVMSIVFFLMSIGSMSHVEIKKQPCRPVKFNDQGPFNWLRPLVRIAIPCPLYIEEIYDTNRDGGMKVVLSLSFSNPLNRHIHTQL